MNINPIEEENKEGEREEENILEPVLKKTYTIFVNLNNVKERFEVQLAEDSTVEDAIA